MKLRAILLAAVPFLLSMDPCARVRAQGSAQWLAASDPHYLLYPRVAVATMDGATVFQTMGDSGLAFTRVNATGTVDWSVRIARDQFPLPLGKTAMTAMPDGGIALLLHRPGSPGADSAHADLVRISTTGNWAWSRLITVPGNGMAVTIDDLGVEANAQGELFVRVSITDASIVMKLDAPGTVLWSRRIGDGAPGSFTREIAKVVPLSDGGCAFLGTDELPTEAGVSVGRLDANGGLLWHKAFTYDAQPVAFLDPALAVGPGDALFVCARLDLIGISNNILLHRIDAGGALLRSDLYEAGDGLLLNDPIPVPVGTNDLVLLAWSPAGLFMPRATLIRLDGQHAVMEAFAAVSDTVSSVGRTVTGWHGAARNGVLHLVGEYWNRHLAFGTEEHAQALWRIQGPLHELCFLEPFAVQHTAIPSGLVNVQAVGTIQNTAGSSTLVPSLHALLAPPVLGSFCSATSVNAHDRMQLIPVHPNPVRAGDRVHVAFDGPARVRVFDAFGRVVMDRTLVSGDRGLQLDPGMGPGLYGLEISPRNEEGMLRGRLIVE